MNYPLLITVCSLLVGLFGMERWCSWRLGVLQRRARTRRLFSSRRASEARTLADALKGLPTKLEPLSRS